MLRYTTENASDALVFDQDNGLESFSGLLTEMPKIKELNIVFSEMTLDVVHKIIANIKGHRSVIHLAIDTSACDCRSSSSSSPDLLPVLFEAFPDLQKLKITGKGCNEWEALKNAKELHLLALEGYKGSLRNLAKNLNIVPNQIFEIFWPESEHFNVVNEGLIYDMDVMLSHKREQRRFDYPQASLIYNYLCGYEPASPEIKNRLEKEGFSFIEEEPEHKAILRLEAQRKIIAKGGLVLAYTWYEAIVQPRISESILPQYRSKRSSCSTTSLESVQVDMLIDDDPNLVEVKPSQCCLIL